MPAVLAELDVEKMRQHGGFTWPSLFWHSDSNRNACARRASFTSLSAPDCEVEIVIDDHVIDCLTLAFIGVHDDGQDIWSRL